MATGVARKCSSAPWCRLLNGVLSTADDHFVVAYGETALLKVMANDNMLPDGAAGLILATNVTASSQPGQPVAVGNAFVYTETNGLDSLMFTYEECGR